MAILAAVKQGDKQCEHEWKTMIKMLPIDNPEYTQGRAAFKLLLCAKCKKTEYLDYKIERI